MYVIVKPLGVKYNKDKELLIFDTSDATLEYVDKSDILSLSIVSDSIYSIYGTKIIGFYGSLEPYTEHGLSYAVDRFIIGDSNNVKASGVVVMKSLSKFEIAGYPIEISHRFIVAKRKVYYKVNNEVEIPDTIELQTGTFGLHYAFFYKDLLVSRFTINHSNAYYTVVTRKDGEVVSLYNEKAMLYGDAAVRTSIEMKMRY